MPLELHLNLYLMLRSRLMRDLYYTTLLSACQPLFSKKSNNIFDTANHTNMIALTIRCIIIYALLLIAMRLTGKRQIGELEISELITTLLLSELAAIPITDPNIPLLYAIVPIFVLCALEVIITYLTSVNPKLRSVIAGKPSAVIVKGRINQSELKKLRMSASELMSQLRINGICDPSEVLYAFFEEDGQISVLEKNKCDYLFLLVLDGHVSSFDLEQSGWNEERIKRYLDSKKILISDILLMTLDRKGKISIILKEEK